MPEYRKILVECREKGKAMPFQGEGFTRDAVLKQIQEYAEGDGEVSRELLWILEKEEKLERGMYQWNRPSVDLAIVATPVVMALVLEEYELAQKCCEKEYFRCEEEWGEELYQSDGFSFIGGGSYSFFEAWMLCEEIPEDYMNYFSEKIVPYITDCTVKLWEGDRSVLQEFQFHRKGQQLRDKQRPIEFLKKLRGINREAFLYFLPYVMEYILESRLDTEVNTLWQGVFEEFYEVVFALKREHRRYLPDSVERGV